MCGITACSGGHQYDLSVQSVANGTQVLVDRLKSYCLPGDQAAVRGIRGIRTSQRGEIRMARDARWNPFTADESVAATCSGFRWQARIGTGALRSVHVTDAYEKGHGQLLLKKGPIALKKMVGADVDRGELQRYLGYIGYCPAMLLNHPSLELTAVGDSTLRVRDRIGGGSSADDRAASSEVGGVDVFVDYELEESGRPTRVCCVRPMVVGNRVIPTPWSGSGSDEREWEGMRIARHLEAAWNPPEGSFTYIRIDLVSVEVLH